MLYGEETILVVDPAYEITIFLLTDQHTHMANGRISCHLMAEFW